MSDLLSRTPDAPPLHVQVSRILKERIVSGAWRSGSSIPAEKELCEEFGVARGTIRQALQTLESEGVLHRQQGRGTFVIYTPNQPPSRQLAFVVPYVRDSSLPAILIGFQQVAEQANFSVVFNHVNNSIEQQERVLRKLVGDGTAGIALYPVDSETQPEIEALVRARYPLVLIDRYLRGTSTDYVMSDHFGGALRGTHYVLAQGHRRVGFVSWLSPAVSMEHRYLAYAQALLERGIPVDEALVCRVEGYPLIDLSPLCEYLSSPGRPTAVFAANDQIAIALYRAAAIVGLAIPKDLSILGFDNLDVSDHLDPPLTTLAQPFVAIGQEAAKILIRRVKGDGGALEQISLPPELVIRSSCIRPEPDNLNAS